MIVQAGKRGWLGTIYLLVLTSLNKLLLILKTFTFLQVKATLMRKLTVPSLPLQLVFPGSCFLDQLLPRYLVFTSKHHDGFTNWPSSYSFGWNSMDVGPQKNVLQELKQALAERQPGKIRQVLSFRNWATLGSR
jgi:hypothetical protein